MVKHSYLVMNFRVQYLLLNIYLCYFHDKCIQFSLAAFCRGSDLYKISPPAFLKPSTTVADIIVDGQSVSYVCRNSSLLIPEELDDDSNFVLEVTCFDGTFEVPRNWPPEKCIENVTCVDFPEPPVHTELLRADHNKEMRPGDMAYFVCKNPEMLLKPNGSNMFSASCGQAKLSTIIWPNCTLEPVCVDIPEPSNESLLTRGNTETMVKIGEYVRYECKNKELFFETPNEVSIPL